MSTTGEERRARLTSVVGSQVGTGETRSAGERTIAGETLERTGQTTAGIEVVAGDAGKTGGIVTGGAGRVSTLQARRVGVQVVTGQTGVASSSVGTAQTAESGVALKAGTTDQVVPCQTGKALGGRKTGGTGTQRTGPARLVVAIDTGETCAR